MKDLIKNFDENPSTRTHRTSFRGVRTDFDPRDKIFPRCTLTYGTPLTSPDLCQHDSDSRAVIFSLLGERDELAQTQDFTWRNLLPGVVGRSMTRPWVSPRIFSNIVSSVSLYYAHRPYLEAQ